MYNFSMNSTTNTYLGHEMKRIRKEAGLTQEDFALRS